MKIKKLLITSLLVGGTCFSLTSCDIVPSDITPTPPASVEEAKEYAITIVYPENVNETFKGKENKTVSLNDYVKDIDGYTFQGFYLEETYETRVTTITFDANKRIYAKYMTNDTSSPDTPVHEHTYKETYDYDNVSHWHSCVDGDAKIGNEMHSFIEEATDEYKISDATLYSKALYRKHCSVCGKLSETFEYGDVLHESFALNVYINDSISPLTYTIRDDEVVDTTSILSDINSLDGVNDKLIVEGLFLNSSFTAPFEKELLTENTNIYVKTKEKYFTITFKIDLDATESSMKVLNGIKVTKEDLSFVAPDGYKITGWYVDEEKTIEFDSLEMTENITLYPKLELILKYGDVEYYNNLPDYYETSYSMSDKLSRYLTVYFNKEIENVSIKAYDEANNEYIGTINIISNTNSNNYVDISFELPVQSILDKENKSITFTKYILLVDDEVLEIIDEEPFTFTLENKELITPHLNYQTIYNDYSVYVQNKENNPSLYKEQARENWIIRNKNGDYFDSYWNSHYKKGVAYLAVDNVFDLDMDNLDVLTTNLILDEDITISSRANYLRSIFVYENYCGDFNLNGHTIYLTFDGIAGDGLFKNNYGKIHNGTIIISGLRDASTNNDTFNVIKNNYALLKNNYGEIYDLEIAVNNFGYNFTTKHNINYVIEANMPLADVHDVNFILYESYVGTKEDRIKNPLATSMAGIFGEVKTGTLKDYSLAYDSSQELTNLRVKIASFSASNELNQKGLVELKLENQTNVPGVVTAKPAEDYWAEEPVEGVSDNNKTFYGGNYYFDGTSYKKFNNILYTDSKTVYGSDVRYLNELRAPFNDVSSITSTASMFTYGVIDSVTWGGNRSDREQDYYKCTYCAYGYLLPEFEMVAYNNTNIFANSDNLVKYSWYTKEEFEGLTFDEDTIIKEEGNFIKAASPLSKPNVAFINLYVDVSADMLSTHETLSKRAYHYYNWITQEDVYNEALNYYNVGYKNGEVY